MRLKLAFFQKIVFNSFNFVTIGRFLSTDNWIKSIIVDFVACLRILTYPKRETVIVFVRTSVPRPLYLGNYRLDLFNKALNRRFHTRISRQPNFLWLASGVGELIVRKFQKELFLLFISVLKIILFRSLKFDVIHQGLNQKCFIWGETCD